jgi:hypothetical protein
MTGDFPKNEVDHRDGNVTNNKWLNLRDVDHVLNQRNKKKHRNNTSGYNGIIQDRRWYRAHIGGMYLGTRATPEEAYALIQEYIKAHPELEYTERHGK